jgi:hypothetical protein
MNSSSSFDATKAELDAPVAPVNQYAAAGRWAGSPDIWVMWQPTAAYQWLAATGGAKGRAITRPLFVAFVLGCMVSLIASGRLALRLVADGTLNALIVPLAEIAALAVVCRHKRTVSFSRIIDLSFAGHGPWLVWMILFSTMWAFLSPIQAFSPRWQEVAHYSVFVVLLWSGSIDFAFFRSVMQRTSAQAIGDLLLQRAIAWTLAILVFGGGALAPEITRILHL